MAKGRSDLPQFLEGYKLHKADKAKKDILSELERKYSKAVAPRTMDDWIKSYKSVPEEEQKYDKPFIWRKSEEIGIPKDLDRLENLLVYCDAFIFKNGREASFREAKWMYMLDMTAKGKWTRGNVLVELAKEYADVEVAIIFEQQTEKDFQVLDAKFKKEREKISGGRLDQ